MAQVYERFLRDALAVRHDLHDRKPPWMENVIATGFGPKLVDGNATDEPAIQFFLKTKRANKRIARTLRVPKSIEGFTTDVLPGTGGVALNALSLPATDVALIGAGVAITSSAGERGTVTCAATDDAGQPVFITAAHFVTEGREVRNDSEAITLGTVRTAKTLLTGDELYPGFGLGDIPCRVDVAVVVPAPGVVPRGGLPTGGEFSVQSWKLTFTWMMAEAKAGRHALVMTFGAVHQGGKREKPEWRTGGVVSVFPRAVVRDITYFCSIFDEKKSYPGDSGSLWICHMADGRRPAIGIHYGIMDDSQYALVTDISSALPFVGIQTLLGTS